MGKAKQIEPEVKVCGLLRRSSIACLHDKAPFNGMNADVPRSHHWFSVYYSYSDNKMRLKSAHDLCHETSSVQVFDFRAV